ncbi:MAG TPA: CDF family Co(II)/Ni(II) efflux transporter DmeF [Stellaceae bacterium]|nr:CDF family Co(II)/Ni(II) efflux transporter DmeF [Stellaceae bacterium]
MGTHSHVFLGTEHEANERKTWAVIALCLTAMVVEIGGGTLFGSLALVADGWHMSTHAAAMLIAALAYRFARARASDGRFSFGTGKIGDLAGFTSAIILAMIALVIGFDAVTRLLAPVSIDFNQAIPIAFLGLLVNILSAWLLRGHHDHDHDIHHDHTMRATFVHVAADAAVSLLAILGLLLGKFWGLLFMDPVMGILGALVIANWSFGLIRDTGGILLDMMPDPRLAESIRRAVEAEGDRVVDLHLWRLGPGHLGAILSVATSQPRDCDFYRTRLSHFPHLSHVTVEIERR